jgi:hypothetical protein
MRKLSIAAIIIAAAFSLALAQDTGAQNTDSATPNMGQAPTAPNGVGRLDLRVVDESGQPVKGAYARLASTRSDGYFCESWNSTDAKGVAVLPPIHMGALKLTIKAKGYQTQKIDVNAETLGQPVRVTLARKK